MLSWKHLQRLRIVRFLITNNNIKQQNLKTEERFAVGTDEQTRHKSTCRKRCWGTSWKVQILLAMLNYKKRFRNTRDKKYKWKKPTFRCILRHYQGYIMIKERFVNRLSWKRICIEKCQADYMNTLARRESDCTSSVGLRSWKHNILLTRQSNLFVHFLITLKRAEKLFGIAVLCSLE